ncbi:MAG: tripartite tricarboxylate transporter substrate-binding protein, partial [Pseudomonadota bacterium]
PSIKEVNGSDLDLGIWFGLFVPKGTPAGIVEKLDGACSEAVTAEAFKSGIANVGWNIQHMGSSEFGPWFEKQYNTNGALLKSLGLAK